MEKRYKNVLLINSKRRLGKGGAIIKGFRFALPKLSSNDILGFVDADNAVYASEFIKMLNFMKNNSEVDGIIASRYIKGSRIVGDLPFSRFIASRLYNVMVKVLFGLKFKDTQCGAKIFRARVIRNIINTLSIVDMSFDINLLYSSSKFGFNIVEFPITYHQVNEGTKLILHRQIPQMLLVTIGFRLSRSRFNRIFPVKLRSRIYNVVKKW